MPSSGKKNRKYGRDIDKCKLYRAAKTREKNKIKRIAHSNGYDRALEYAERFGLTTFVKNRFAYRKHERIVKKKPISGVKEKKEKHSL